MEVVLGEVGVCRQLYNEIFISRRVPVRWINNTCVRGVSGQVEMGMEGVVGYALCRFRYETHLVSC